MSLQLTLDMPPVVTFDLIAERLHVGDDLEGYGGRALPRKRHVLGVETHDGMTRIIYRERRGTENIHDVLTIPADTPVDIAPPF